MSKDKLAEALAEKAGTSVEEVNQATEAAQDDKLKQMLNAAGKAPGSAVPEQKEASNTPRARRNEADTRQIHVMKSEELKQAVIMTHISYNKLDEEARITKFRKATEKQKRVAEINAATDLTFVTVMDDVPVAELDAEKIKLHEQMVADGWKVVSNKPRPPKA